MPTPAQCPYKPKIEELRAMLTGLRKVKQDYLAKSAFLPAPAMPTDPMAGGMQGQPPMDPAMMGMDPAMMAGGGQGMPMDPAMMGQAPAGDPSMMQAPPAVGMSPEMQDKIISLMEEMAGEIAALKGRFDQLEGDLEQAIGGAQAQQQAADPMAAGDPAAQQQQGGW